MNSMHKHESARRLKISKAVKAEMEYDPEMVAKVKRGRDDFKKGKCVTIKSEDIWN